MTESKQIEAVFSRWWTESCTNATRSRIDVELFTHQMLRESHPHHEVVRTNPSKSDLLAYAAAGHASATISLVGYDAARAYTATRNNLENGYGKLADIVSFACWEYRYQPSFERQSTKFLVYEEAYISRFGQNIKRLYVLAPQQSEACSVESAKQEANERIDDLLARSGQWTHEPHEEVWVFDNAQWSKNSSLWRDVQETVWDDIVLSEAVRHGLQRDIHGFFGSRELFQRLRIPWKRGIIFHGPPGTGKSMVIRALMSSLDARDPKVQTLYVKSLDACGGPKWSLQQIFKKARRSAPCLLVLEDLDTLVTDTTRTYFLNEVDGVKSNDGILIIGTTNHLDQLDPAVSQRPSRFDRHYHFADPARDERLEYCRMWRTKYRGMDDVDFPEELCELVADWTGGYSFAYLKELFTASVLFSVTHYSLDKVEEMGSVAPQPNTTNGTGVSKEPQAVLEGLSELPTSLQSNTMARIMQSQARALSSQIKAAGPVVRGPRAPSGQPPIRMPIISPLDQDND